MRSRLSAMFSAVFLAGCLSALGATAQGATQTAASLSQADVQKAVDAAHDGDVVELPAGSATWTGCVKVAGKFLAIRGAGIDKTTIIGGDFPAKSTHRLLEITTKPGGLTRLTELTFDGGTGAKEDNNKGMISLAGDSTTWRVDHIRIRATRTCAMHVHASGGVVDHNTFELVGWTFGIYGFNGGSLYGDAAWADSTDLGSGEKPFFIEDNLFAANDRSYAIDGWAGQRVVIRHNTFKNAMLGNHGTESSGRLRGARSFEIYDNTITLTGKNWPDAIGFRSGVGVIFNNTIKGDFKNAFNVDNYRDWNSFQPWGIATGDSPFDKNDLGPDGKPIVYDKGTHTGATGKPVLLCSGKTWQAYQWRGYSVHNTTTGKSSIITSNNSNIIIARTDSTYGGPNLVWNTGDEFEIKRCLVALDQMGRGKGKLISGDVPEPQAWPEEEQDPTYIWNNTLNSRPARLQSSSPHVLEGVDFFNGVPKPGYKPYRYPHPLVAE